MPICYHQQNRFAPVSNQNPDSKMTALADEYRQQACDLLDQSMIKLKNCLRQLNDEQLWWRPSENLNSIGNLVLHMCGNLRQWSVAGLTDAEDTRDREAEFSTSGGMDAAALLELAQSTVEHAQQVFRSASDQQLVETLVIQGFTVTGLNAILHTATHFVGHTHQIILLTRIQLADAYQFAWTPDQGRDQLPI